MFVHAAGPIRRTQYIISLSRPMETSMFDVLKGCCCLCLTINMALKASMDDIASWLLHLCLTLELMRVYVWRCLAGYCIYVWCRSLLLSSLPSCNAMRKTMALLPSLLLSLPMRGFIWNSSCAIGLVVNIWCCCSLLLLNLLLLCDAACKCAALAQWMATAQTIFLWLRCCCLHIQLALQTLRRQQCKAALAGLQYKQDCCSRTALMEEQHQQVQLQRKQSLCPNALRHRQSWRWPWSIVAESWLNALRHWQSQCQPRNYVADSRQIALQCRQRGLSPMSIVAWKRRNVAWRWGKRRWRRSNVALCRQHKLRNWRLPRCKSRYRRIKCCPSWGLGRGQAVPGGSCYRSMPGRQWALYGALPPSCNGTLKWHALAHEALSLLPLCNVTLKMVCACTQGLVVVAVVQHNV